MILFYFYLLWYFDAGDLDTVVVNFNWFIGVEFNPLFDDIIRVRTGVDAFDKFNKGVDNILFFNDKGPCIYLSTII